MVAYELSLIMKPLSRGKLVTAVKRTAETILSYKGYIEKFEFLGTRQLPYRISSHGKTQNKGSYFLIHYHAPYDTFEDIKDHCRRDTDIVRPMIFTKQLPKEFICTLHDDIQPPSYRAEVVKMMKEAEERLPRNIKNRKKKEEKLKHYPF